MAKYTGCFEPLAEGILLPVRRETLAEVVEKAGHSYPMDVQPEQANLRPVKPPVTEEEGSAPAVPLHNRRGCRKLGDGQSL